MSQGDTKSSYMSAPFLGKVVLIIQKNFAHVYYAAILRIYP